MIPNHDQIAAEAEVLWRQRGCPHNCDEQIWLEAEQMLLRVGSQSEKDAAALPNPLSRLNPKSDDVMGELEELFPERTGRSATSL